MLYNTYFNEPQSPNKGLAISGGAPASRRSKYHAASTKQNVFLQNRHQRSLTLQPTL